MCIIAVKLQGQAPLSLPAITACWNNNPDGAGFVIHRPGHDCLLIQKGFMTLNSLLAALKASAIQEQDTVVYHFRIATSGGVSPANCHPFPVSADVDDLKSLVIACKSAFAHNGVLGKGEKELSDTQLYILNTLSGYESIKDSLPKILEDTAGSRTAILSADGYIWLTGKWVEKDGYYFSNDSHDDLYWRQGLGDMDAFLEICECCRSKLHPLEWEEMLICEGCGAEYAPCFYCGCWNLIDDMDALMDENGNDVLVCFYCSEGPYYDGYDRNGEHGKSDTWPAGEREMA